MKHPEKLTRPIKLFRQTLSLKIYILEDTVRHVNLSNFKYCDFHYHFQLGGCCFTEMGELLTLRYHTKQAF